MVNRVRNIPILNVSATSVLASTASARFPLSSTEINDITVINIGTELAYVKAGDSSVTADATSMPIFPGEKSVYSLSVTEPVTITATHIAYIAAENTTTLKFIQGLGS